MNNLVCLGYKIGLQINKNSASCPISECLWVPLTGGKMKSAGKTLQCVVEFGGLPHVWTVVGGDAHLLLLLQTLAIDIAITVLIQKVYGEALSIDWTKDLCRLLGGNDSVMESGVFSPLFIRLTKPSLVTVFYGHHITSYDVLFLCGVGRFFHKVSLGKHWKKITGCIAWCDDGWLWFFLRWHQLLAMVYTRGVTIRVLVLNFFGKRLNGSMHVLFRYVQEKRREKIYIYIFGN